MDVYDFPRYDQTSSYFVQRYLNGEYGPASEVSPYTASLFYALDRFEAAPQIRQSLADGRIVVANRYAGSNMAHQGSKFTSSGEQRGFFVWADSLEFQLLGIPRPTLNLFLRVPADVSHELIKKKQARSYTEKSHDEHEADIEHLRKSVATYDTLCQLFPRDFKAVECSEDGEILSITEINNRIWQMLKPLLPKPSHSGRTMVVSLDEQLVAETTIKKEPAAIVDSLASRELPQQVSIEVEDISLLALNSFLGTSGVTIKYSVHWPQREGKTRLNYYIPSQFSPKLTKEYNAVMTALSDLYRNIEKKIEIQTKKPVNKTSVEQAKEHLKALIPMTVLCNVSVSGSNKAISDYIHLAAASDLSEIQQLGQQLADGTKKTVKSVSDESLKQPEALKSIVKQLDEVRLSSESVDFTDVKLLHVWPKNELDLLVDCLYPHSSLGREAIAAELDKWTYQQKSDALKAAITQDANIILKKTRYSFDVIDDRLTLEDLVEQVRPSELQLQPPTARYGYEVPAEIEELGLDDKYIECFDLSLRLFSDIQAEGHQHLAGYATLAGHRLRWQFGTNGLSIYKHYPKTSSNFLNLVLSLRGKIAEVHPLISQSAKATLKKQVDLPQPAIEGRQTAKKAAKKRSTKRNK